MPTAPTGASLTAAAPSLLWQRGRSKSGRYKRHKGRPQSTKTNSLVPFCDPHCAFLWFIPLFVIILVRILARPSRSRYLELGAYVWGGTLNQPSGTITERLATA